MLYTNGNITEPPLTFQIYRKHNKIFNENAAVKFTDKIDSNRWRTKGRNVVELHLPGILQNGFINNSLKECAHLVIIYKMMAAY
jgi:hypothetical protein